MTDTRLVTRRATVEDLPQLIPLWRLEQLPAEALEKRFTEFQVVTDDAGQVLGAIGLRIVGTQGCLHSESIALPELSDEIRARLWKRLQVSIQNHALERLWTQMDGMFWREQNFQPATDEQLKMLPAAFQNEFPKWQVLTLRAAVANAALESEMAELKALQQVEAERLRNRVRWAKRIALSVTVVVFILVVIWAVMLLKVGPQLRRSSVPSPQSMAAIIGPDDIPARRVRG